MEYQDITCGGSDHHIHHIIRFDQNNKVMFLCFIYDYDFLLSINFVHSLHLNCTQLATLFVLLLCVDVTSSVFSVMKPLSCSVTWYMYDIFAKKKNIIRSIHNIDKKNLFENAKSAKMYQ